MSHSWSWAFASFVALSSCGGGEPSPKPSATVSASPPQIESDPGRSEVASATPASVHAYAKFLPPELCSMTRRDLQSIPIPAELITARYETDDAKLHVNVGRVDDLDVARRFYQDGYERVVSGPWGVYTRRWTDPNGEQTREACIVLRNTINVCLGAAAVHEPPDPVPCLMQLDLPGLVELAKVQGGATGLADLDFTYTEEAWKEHEAALEPSWSAYERACKLHAAGKNDEAAAALAQSGRAAAAIDAECRMLDETRRDCKSDMFDERLAETDIHLTPHERANFHRTWKITCELELATKP